MCVAEQKFLNAFFHFERLEGVLEAAEDTDEVDGFTKARKLHETFATSSDVGSHSLLNQLFASLLPEIEDFIDFGERQDS